MTGGNPVDDWRPAATPERLHLRARLKGRIRRFFDRCGVLEVDTPVLSSAAPTDPHIHSMQAWDSGEAATRFLHTSPEFPMKRMLAAGIGDCWQLARVFRDGERGRLHVPEFDLLEWYRVGLDHHALMQEVEALVRAAVEPERAVPAVRTMTYRDAFLVHAGIDPVEVSVAELRVALRRAGIAEPAGLEEAGRDDWLDCLLSTVVVPALPQDRLVFIHAWPVSQAALARCEPDDPRLARRFELYWDGIELANGYHELVDAREQRARFEADLERRDRAGGTTVPSDERLLAALAAGLPDCAGVALGFDRLVMQAARAGSIDEVLAFPPERA